MSENSLSPLEERLRKASRLGLVACVILVFTIDLGRIQSGQKLDFSDYLSMNGLNAMNAAGFTALFVAFLGCRPSRRLLYASLAAIIPAEFLFLKVLAPADFTWQQKLETVGGGAGILGLIFMIGMFLVERDQARRRRIEAWLLAGLCLLSFPTLMGRFLGILSFTHPLVFDTHVYGFEGAFGWYPAQEVATFLDSSPWLSVPVMGVYSRLPLWVFLTAWLTIQSPKRAYFDIFVCFLTGGVLCFLFYALLPMIGIDDYLGIPPWPWGTFPEPAGFEMVKAAGSLPRTCFPSMHSAWITLVFFALWRLSPKARIAGTLIFLLTLAGTLSLVVGHYTLDILVGIPFGLALIALGARKTEQNHKIRMVCIAYGFGIVTIWGALFRWTPSIPNNHATLCWLLLLVGCVGTFPLEHHLASQSLPTQEKS